MIEEIKTAYRFLIVLGIGGLLLLLSVMVPVVSSDADFSIYNTGWNGCSELGKEAYGTGSLLPTVDISSSSQERILHTSLDELEGDIDPENSAIMIIGPELDFNEEERSYLHEFTALGGILFIADDFGSSDRLLSHLQTDTRITGSAMMDLSFMKSAEFSVTRDMKEHNITEGVDTILMNHPSTVSPGNNAETLINSSGASWLDRDLDGVRDVEEPQGPFSILTVENYGRGELIILSEPSLLINDMKEHFNNSRLLSNLIEHITNDRDTLVIDESHRDLANPVQYSNMIVGSLDIRGRIGILTGLIIFLVVISTPLPLKIWRGSKTLLRKVLSEESRKEPALDETLKRLFEKHPDWDRETIRRMIDDIEGA